MFTSSCTNISIDNWQGLPLLKALCNTKDGGKVWSSISFNVCFGYDSHFDGPSMAYSGGGEQVDVQSLELVGGGAVLKGRMKRGFGGREFALCLDFFIFNDNGDLVKQIPPGNCRMRMSRARIDQDGILSGFTLAMNGRIQYTKLALGDHLTNDCGILKQKKWGNFQRSARNLRLDDDWTFFLDLEYPPHIGGYNRNIQCWELMEEWVRVDDYGSLVMEDPYGDWDLRGPYLRMLEEIPVVGFIISGIDDALGDEDEAIRAKAECTYTTICLAAAFVGGIFLGPVGAAIGSAVAAYAGMYAKAAIGKHISDPKMRNEVTAITVYRVLVTELLVITGCGLGEAAGAFTDLLADELLAVGFDGLLMKMGTYLGRKGLKKLTKEDAKIIINNLLDAIKHGKSEDDIKHMFGDYSNDGIDLLNHGGSHHDIDYDGSDQPKGGHGRGGGHGHIIHRN